MYSIEAKKLNDIENSRVCIFSMRNYLRDFYRCLNYEFEDIICQIDNVDLLAPYAVGSISQLQKVLNRFCAKYRPQRYKTLLEQIEITKNYKLFFFTCMFVKDLIHLNALKGWRKHCALAVCYITEYWAKDIPRTKSFWRILSQFDYVFLNTAATMPKLQESLFRPCHYIMPGVDTLRFCPYPNQPPRSIDVYSLGRKSQEMHEALLKLVAERQIFYLYDTYIGHEGWSVENYRQHRDLSANLIKRSQYFVVNPAKIDEKFETDGQIEIGPRFFEGAAAGAVLIGRPVESKIFRHNFDWEDAVIPMPANLTAMKQTLLALNSQQDRLEKIRKENVVNCLLRHDWAYRWREILEKIKFELRPALFERESKLLQMAQNILPEPSSLERTLDRKI